MSKSRFIISVRKNTTADKQEILNNFVSDAASNHVEFLSELNPAATGDWFVALMDEPTQMKLCKKYDGQLIIEPDADLMY